MTTATARPSLPLRFVRAMFGLNPCAAGHDLREHGLGQWACARCGYQESSERGPHYAEQPYFLVHPVAKGPNCGWVSQEQEEERKRLCAEREIECAEREIEAAKWRTRQGHDIHLMGEHWAQVQLCRSWPDSTPGMEPIHVWTCRYCGSEFRQQIASSFSYSEGRAIGHSDRFSTMGGLQIEESRIFEVCMAHLSEEHRIDVGPIITQRVSSLESMRT